MSSHGQELVIGVIFPTKKIDRLMNVLSEVKDGVRFVLLDLEEQSLASADQLHAKYGHLDAVLHKLAHEMVFVRFGDERAAQRLTLMEDFAQKNPHVKWIDPLESVRLLTDRHRVCVMLQKMEAASKGTSTAMRVPKFYVVGSKEQFAELQKAVEMGDAKLPLICKSIEACATDRSHLMSVITKREDLQYVEYPALYQEFINHSSRLFKGYVLGDLINVAERCSLPNLQAGAHHVHFNTQEKYPTTDDFHPTLVADASSPSPSLTVAVGNSDQQQLFAVVRAIGEKIREELHLSLFGFDVIVSDDTKELYVIDVNYFPSYKELDDFDQLLRHHIKKVCTNT